jgi:LysM repeat protein
MRDPRNQLIIAIVFALLLGIIIVGATRCGSTSATPAATRTPTASKTVKPGTPSPVRSVTVAATRTTTETVILPPGGLPAPTPTPISVGPQPVATPSQVAAQPITQPGGAPQLPPTPTPVVQAPPATTAPSTGLTYTVQRGDTLSAIAKRFGTTVDAIVRANGITNPSRIVTGQKLIIPGATTSSSSATGGRVYIVQRGDTLSRIAARYGTTVNAIVKANNLSNPNYIYAGQRLIIP